MHTKTLMTASSVFMGLMGIILSFIPSEVLAALGQMPNNTLNLILQLFGAIYFGFAMTNWMAKGVLIGGIYSKPLSIGNFSHFLIAGLALAKALFSMDTASTYIYILTTIYVLFAILFGHVTFTHPVKDQQD